MKIEIIATNLADILLLNKIDKSIEVELCAQMDKDGLTPDLKTLEECVLACKHPIRVMIRNHDAGFFYSKADLEMMIEQIRDIKTFCYPTGFVYGCLNEKDDKIDFKAMELLSTHTKEYSNTFHMASSKIFDVNEFLKLKDMGVKRILLHKDRKDLVELKSALENDFELIVGGNINLDNYQDFTSTFGNIHVGRAVRQEHSYQNNYSIENIEKFN